MGVWIEINEVSGTLLTDTVTPFVGVWIEIENPIFSATSHHVTPFVGVWIEMLVVLRPAIRLLSLPSWECGLKSVCFRGKERGWMVTPFVGVWIEI